MSTKSSVAFASKPLPPSGTPARRGAEGPRGELAGSLRDLLLNACLLAASRGMDDEVGCIRTVLLGLGMDGSRLSVAIAIVQLRSGNADGSLVTLERDVLSHEPGHELALAVQAGAWRSQGRREWRAQAQALLATSADPMVRSFVQSRC